MVLQILFIVPSDLVDPSASFRDVINRIVVSPIVKTLVFAKVPRAVFTIPRSILFRVCATVGQLATGGMCVCVRC